MYNKLQNLKQGARSVDDYAEEFYLLLTRNEIADSQVQLVSRFIGGLRPQLQSSLAQFDPTTVSEAHRRAASFEQQFRSSSWSSSTPRARLLEQNNTSASPVAKDASDPGKTEQKLSFREDENGVKRSTRNALRCFSCGELGHRQTACPKQQRRSMLIDDNGEKQEPVYDSTEEVDGGNDDEEHATFGDTGTALVSRRVLVTPPGQADNWLRYNIFKSTCTIRDRICTFVIDSGSSRNIISEAAVRKLELPVEIHPCPYPLTWLHDGVDLRVTHRTLIPFSIGQFYRDRFYFDIAPMDVAHLILGRPWEYDRKLIHDGFKNTYKFTWETHQILLLPSPELTCNPSPPPPKEEPKPRSSTFSRLSLPPTQPSAYGSRCHLLSQQTRIFFAPIQHLQKSFV